MTSTRRLISEVIPALSFAVLLAGPALAQDDGGAPATLSTGASWSSLRGGLAFVGFEADDIFRSGIDLELHYEEGDDGNAASARISKTFDLGVTRLGRDSYVRLSLDGYKSDWDSQQYALSHTGGELRFGATSASNLDYEGRLFWSNDNLERFGAGASPLILADIGKSDAIGVGARIGYSTYDRRVLPTSGFELGFDAALATPAGDREWLATSVYAGYARPLPRDWVLSLTAEAGRIKGLNGDTVQIMDRAFLGNPNPRGFASAGIGPRDYVPGPGGVDSPLGGNRYVSSSVEVRIPTGNPRLQVGAFVDAAALWDLDVTAGGASGVIDDDFHLRTSAGLSAYWETSFGLVQINLAAPMRKEDYDNEENFSLGLSVGF